LGNDFFGLFLDKSYTYSCAYFKTPDDSLEAAQNNKYELICRKIYLKDNDKVVDVGCGFGGFLIYAAKRNNIKGLG
jgi:cyclopropane-fatty-acyl-phospholipid synthase